jgi:hypothetical protein
MKFEVDASGNVSGGNKNDNDPSGVKKTYTGTFINNQMNVTATFSNGQVNQYQGTVTGNQFKGTLKVSEEQFKTIVVLTCHINNVKGR